MKRPRATDPTGEDDKQVLKWWKTSSMAGRDYAIEFHPFQPPTPDLPGIDRVFVHFAIAVITEDIKIGVFLNGAEENVNESNDLVL